jgi:hypothetical protein
MPALLLPPPVVGLCCWCLAPLPPHSPQLPIRSFHHPPLLETRPQQRPVMNTLRIWDREPLRSTSRLLGFIVGFCIGDPSDRVLVGARSGPRCLQDPLWLATPGPFLGRHLVAVDYRGPVAMKLISAAFRRGRGGCGCWRSRDAPGHVVSRPPHWISASTRLATLVEFPPSTGGKILTS